MSDTALDLLAALRLEDGRRWGEAAESFQWEDARAVLAGSGSSAGHRSDRQSALYHYLTRGRGGAKTSDLAALSTVAMLAQLPPASRLYALAADRDQGRLLVDSIAGYAARTPELRNALRVDAYRVTATKSGSLLDVLAADAPSAWGLRPSFLVVDELAQWASTPGPRRLWEAVTSAVAKINGARMVILSSAGDLAHWSAKVLEHAKADPLWRVHEVPGPVPWLDADRLEEQRRRLPESSYRRLFLNEWVAAEDRLVAPDDLAACVTLDGPLAPESGRQYVIGVDLGLAKDATAAVVAHAEKALGNEGEQLATRVIVDRLEVWQGRSDARVQIADVEEWISQAVGSYRPAKVVIDPWQAVGMAQRLRSRSVQIEEFTFSSASVGRLASTLHLLLRNRALALPDDEALLDELRNVRLRETSPGVMRIDHDPDKHDDRAIALGLACVQLLSRPSGTLHRTQWMPNSRTRRESRYIDRDTGLLQLPPGTRLETRDDEDD